MRNNVVRKKKKKKKNVDPDQLASEMFSVVILSLQLIQEEHLSVSGERMCTILVNR